MKTLALSSIIGVSILTVFSANAIPIGSVGEQSESFFTHGVAAEKSKDELVARNCYHLALRAQPGHKRALDALAALGKKEAEAKLANGDEAEGKGDLASANLLYLEALRLAPDHPEATKKTDALKKKMGAAFREGESVFIEAKLKKTIIPRIDFEDTTLKEAVDFLRLRSQEFDVLELDPLKRGIKFVLPKVDSGEALRKLPVRELRIRNVPLGVALKYICDQTKTRYLVDDSGVTVVMANSPQIAPPLAKNAIPAAGPAGALANPSSPLVWKSKDGKSVQGEFVGLDGEAVVIKRDGKEVTIPFNRLDAASVVQARNLATFQADVLLHYDFSESSGITVKDLSGNRRDGTLTGFSNTEAGGSVSSGWTKEGSLIFDGLDDAIVTPLLLSDLAMGPGFTIEAVVGHRNPLGTWSSIVATDAPNMITGGVVQLAKVAKGGDYNCPESAILARVNGLSIPVGKAKKPTSLGDGRLHHVAMVYDSIAGTLRIYFDQQLHGQWADLRGNILTGSRILIGSSGWKQGEGWFGPISEVRISKRPLTPGQFLAYPKLPASPAPKPVHRYSFNGDANDSIGTAHGKVVDRGSPTARFTQGQFDLSGNRGELSPEIMEDAYLDLPNGLVSKCKGRYTFELWCAMSHWRGWITACSFGRSADDENISSPQIVSPYACVHLVLRGDGFDLGSWVTIMNQDSPNIEKSKCSAGFDVSQVGIERHYALVIDATDTSQGLHGSQYLYLDGYRVASGALPPGVDTLEDINNWLGKSQSNNPTFVGKYNEFRIYDKALSPQEVLTSYLTGPDFNFQPASSPILNR